MVSVVSIVHLKINLAILVFMSCSILVIISISNNIFVFSYTNFFSDSDICSHSPYNSLITKNVFSNVRDLCPIGDWADPYLQLQGPHKGKGKGPLSS